MTSKTSAGFLVLSALVFAAVGAVILFLLGQTWLEYSAIQGWEEAPARIVRAELRSHRSQKSTSYEATAEHTYVFRDRQYTGTRVGIHGGADNLGWYQKTSFDVPVFKTAESRPDFEFDESVIARYAAPSNSAGNGPEPRSPFSYR